MVCTEAQHLSAARLPHRKKIPHPVAPKKKSCTFAGGEMAEWSIAAVLKTVDPHGSGGSNPSLSAARCKIIRISKLYQASLIFYFKLLRQSQTTNRSQQAKSCRFLAFKFCKKSFQNSEICQTESTLFATMMPYMSSKRSRLHKL